MEGEKIEVNSTGVYVPVASVPDCLVDLGVGQVGKEVLAQEVQGVLFCHVHVAV